MFSLKQMLVLLFVVLLSTASCQTKNKPSSSAQNSSTGSKTTAAQTPLKATIKAVYPDKDPAFNFQSDVMVESGTIKTGDKIDAVSADGKRYTFTVVKIRNPFEDIKSADNNSGTVYLHLKGPADAVFNTNFTFVTAGGAAPATNTNAKSTDGLLTVKLNGTAWTGNGFNNSHLFYKKGVKQFNDGKPSMVLAFKSVQSPDDRQFTIKITTADAKPGIYKGEQIELLLSGSPTGDTKNPEMYGYKYPETVTANLSIEITSYKENGDGTATISGKISGNLKPVLMKNKQELRMENGSFENVIVKVFNEKY